MAPHASKELKARIVTKLEYVWSLFAVASHFNVSRTTVLNINKRWREQETLERKQGSGRPKISTAHEDRTLLERLEENPFEDAKTARIMSQFPGRKTTTWRRIKASRLRYRTAAKNKLLHQNRSILASIYC